MVIMSSNNEEFDQYLKRFGYKFKNENTRALLDMQSLKIKKLY